MFIAHRVPKSLKAAAGRNVHNERLLSISLASAGRHVYSSASPKRYVYSSHCSRSSAMCTQGSQKSAPAGRYVYHVSVSSSASKTYLGLYGTSKGSKGFSIAIARLWRNGTSSQLQTYRSSGAKAHMSPLWGFREFGCPITINMSPLWG